MQQLAARRATGALPARQARPALPSICIGSKRANGVASRQAGVAAALPAFDLAAAEGIRASLAPTAEYFASLNLPAPLIKYGHPGNMAVVLGAMAGYGSWLGWQIRLSGDQDVIAKAKDLHPKLLGGAFVFFALGATGGCMSLIMQGKPIFESAHVTTALWGLTLLAFQAMLPLFFDESPGSRTVHAFFGTGIMGLMLIHAGLGVQLALSL
ncbi:translation initiation factor [Raphidocelis subcapitata]|uniref:Translation initiation factor n=1 Tax=Raphidocelis subcapitata TaxID=307507 RepID=A0A2V0P790_9CHLO|nr:translation initiation factor [Raphidocelis subcapitata]|eukprot:GBF94792.1 translation initiation factor [Raphidocelis subcapitata]